jgi:hypothetical protein
MNTNLRTIALILLASAGAAACVTTRAQTPADRPALEVPAPPERLVPQVPAPEPIALPIEPVEDIPAKPSSPTKPKPQAKQQEPPKGDPAKPDTPVPAAEPPPTPPPATPQLKLPETGDVGVISRQIRDTIERTRRILGQTQRAKLTAVRQKNYDEAQLFAKQAEDALNANNLALAKELAEKAERLGKDIQNR